MCARWSPVLLSGDGHTRRRRQAPRDEQSRSIQFAFLSDGNFCSTSIALLPNSNRRDALIHAYAPSCTRSKKRGPQPFPNAL